MWVFKGDIAWDICIILAAEFARDNEGGGILRAIWGGYIKVVKRDRQGI
jgi:hypothetical protein